MRVYPMVISPHSNIMHATRVVSKAAKLSGVAFTRIAWLTVLLVSMGTILSVTEVRAADFSITDYGAVSGDADDLAAIQATFTAAAAGDRVLIPTGTFQISDAIIPKAHVALVGDGMDQSIIEYIGTSSGPMMRIQAAGLNGVELTGFTLDGQGSSLATQGIEASGTSGHYIHGIRVRDLVDASGFGPHGIYGSGGLKHCLIEGNEFINIGTNSEWGAGIRLNSGSSGNVVISNLVQNVGRGGILLSGATDCEIKGNTVLQSGQTGPGLGIELWGGSDRGIVEDNNLDHWFSIDSSSQIAVRRNTVSAADGSLQLIGMELAGGEDCIFTHNTVGRGNHIGLSLSNNSPKRRAYFAENEFSESETWGCQLQDDQGEIRQLYFYDNVFRDTIAADPNLYDSDTMGFRFLAWGNGAGIRQIVFDSNRVIDNDEYGFALFGTYSETNGIDELSFVSNTITGNGWDAIANYAGIPNIEWSGNMVSGNGNNATPTSTGFPNGKPTVTITGPDKAVVGQPVSFSLSYTDDGGVMPAEVLWDFDEGIPETAMTPSRTFHKMGTHTVSVIAWDAEGRAAHARQVVEVTDNGVTLSHLYTFNGGSFTDLVGGLDGTLAGAASISGGSLILNGGTGELDAPNLAINSYNSISIEIWATSDDALNTGYSSLFGLGEVNPTNTAFASNYLYLQTQRGDNVARVAIATNNRDATPWTSEDGVNTPEINDNSEHQYVITVDGIMDQINLYVDGVHKGMVTSVQSLSNIATDLASLGSLYPQDPTWFGSVNELAIYNGSLAAEQVAELFAAGTTIDAEPAPTSAIAVLGEVEGSYGFQMSFSDLVIGKRYHLEASADLNSLAPMPGSTFTAASGTNEVVLQVDTAAYPRQFYRLVEGEGP